MLPDEILDRLHDSATEACTLLKVLSNKDRFLILCHLAKRTSSVGELEANLGITQPTLSQQLSILREKNIVESKREGKLVYYRIANQDAVLIMGTLSKLYCDTVEKLRITQHTDHFFTSTQISEKIIGELKKDGFEKIICLREQKEIGNKNYKSLEEIAKKLNVDFIYFPVKKEFITDEQIKKFGTLIKNHNRKTLAFCRGGTVSEKIYQLSNNKNQTF